MNTVVSLNSIQCKLTYESLEGSGGCKSHTITMTFVDDRAIFRYSGYLITFIWKHIRNRKDHCHGSFAHHYILSSSQSCHLQQVSEIKRPLFLVTHRSSLLAHTGSTLAALAMSIYLLAHMPGALSQLPENAACYNISRPSMSLFSFNSQGNNHLIIKQSWQLLTTLYSGMLSG